MTLLEQQASQNAYMNALLEKAKEIALKIPDDQLMFDPQGRLIIDVPLDGIVLPKGIKPTKVTTVSLDISNIRQLKDKFDERLLEQLKKGTDEKYAKNIQIAYNTTESGSSIIALQQEFHFNLSLALRTYQKHLPKTFQRINQQELDAAHKAAMHRVNTLVMEAFAKALIESTNGNVIDVDRLNKAMDKARKAIMPKAHTFLLDEITRHTGVIITSDQLEAKTGGKTLKEHAEETTATANDLLHTDKNLKLATWIAGSDNTAHHRLQGKYLADRQIITQSYIDGKTIAHKKPRIQIRSPSIALKKKGEFKRQKNVTDKTYIKDVVHKLNHISDRYALSEQLSSDKKKPKAFVYNLLTALSNQLEDVRDESTNKQAKSAGYILQGAHDYNAEQLHDKKETVFCFIQNISVNGFGNSLSDTSTDPLVAEATLMSEMALLHTLYDSCDDKDKEKLGQIFDQYKSYLGVKPRETYFHKTQQAETAKKLITEIKTKWTTEKSTTRNADTISLMQTGLKKMMAGNQHLTNSGRLIQSLSVVLEEASIVGCKSGNERAQMINGRAALFDMLMNTPNDKSLTHDGQLIKSALENLANASSEEEIQKTTTELESIVDKTYNKLNLQSAASIISLVDQGGPAKVEAKSDYLNYNTNHAEAKSTIMTYLHQDNAGGSQSHKGMTEQMISASKGHPKTIIKPVKNRYANAFIWLLAILFTAGSILVVQFFNNRSNDNKLKDLRKTQEASQKEYFSKCDSTQSMLKGELKPNITDFSDPDHPRNYSRSRNLPLKGIQTIIEETEEELIEDYQGPALAPPPEEEKEEEEEKKQQRLNT